ncbi:MAG: ABC transporter substrate-binding protein [Rhodocyclaceae bacterium]|nr:ABC transporter substrate-binding protein [Rhodocyclaceae bacterium]
MTQLIATRLSLPLPRPDGGHWQLEDFDLTVKEGDALAIVGAQPGLAQAMLNALAGEVAPARGGVLLNQRELRAPDPRITRISLSAEGSAFRSVAGYLRKAATGRAQRGLGPDEIDRWVNHNLHLVGMDDVGPLGLRRLSPHARARVQLARGLITEPGVLFIDHLFDALDETPRHQCMDMFLDLHDRMATTLIFATDDIDQAVLFADRVLCLKLDGDDVLYALHGVDLLRPRARVDLARSPAAKSLREALHSQLGRHGPATRPPAQESLAPADDDSVVFMDNWVASHPARAGKVLEKQHLTLGFLPLIDCAPLAVALEEGFFKGAGLNVTLSRESSWNNVQDKVSLGLLDGAQMLAATPLVTALDTSLTPLVTAMSLGRNGNAITVSHEVHARLNLSPEQPVDPRTAVLALRAEVDRRRRERLRHLIFAIVAPHSSHNYLLRYWLACGGIDPDRDIKLVVVPPPQMVNYLGVGMIDGFCVGEPWNTVARDDGFGVPLLASWQIWNNHPEKVLGVTRAWADAHPNTHRTLVKALLDACWWLDKPDNRSRASEILSHGRYVNIAPDVIERSLASSDAGNGTLAMHQCFHSGAANFPWHSHAAWLLAQMVRWGQARLPNNVPRLCAATYRTDIYRSAVGFGDACPGEDWKAEGAHADAWQMDGAERPVELGPDRFFDAAVLPDKDITRVLASYAIPEHHAEAQADSA